MNAVHLNSGSGDWPKLWQGRWIWAVEAEPPTMPQHMFDLGLPAKSTWNRFCYLRRSFTLDQVPARVPARVTADSRYVLYVNGTEVSRGPARTAPPRLAFEELDLAPQLRSGENVIAAIVRFYGYPSPWWRPFGHSGQLGLGSFLFEAPSIEVVSDASWRGDPAPYQQETPTLPLQPANEILDGSRIPVGWNDSGFDDAAWKPAVELVASPLNVRPTQPLSDPFYTIEPSGIAPLTAYAVPLERVGSGTSRPGDGDVLALGFPPNPQNATDEQHVSYAAPYNTLATPWLEVSGKAGDSVDIYVGEDLRPDGRVESAPRAYGLRYQLRGGGPERVEGFESVGLRYLSAVPHGDVDVIAAGAVERRYPRSDVASFRCSDERLNRIWEAGARTLDLCSTDTFLDCPGREQRTWLGDAYVEALVALVCSSDWRLTRRNLVVAAHDRRADGLLNWVATGDLAIVPTTIPEFSLHWIRTVCRYFEYTGDVATVIALLPAAAEAIAAFERNRSEDGLIRGMPGFVFIDWAQIHRGEVTGAQDALFAATLDDYANLLDRLGRDPQARDDARAGAQRTRQAFDVLWDASRGVYVDSITGKERSTRVSQQTNAAAIEGGCAPRERWDSMLTYILDGRRIKRTSGAIGGIGTDGGDGATDFNNANDVVEAQPFFAHILHQAVVRAGHRERIADLCLRWYAQIARGSNVFEEMWDAEPGKASRCHAWSSTPTYDLTAHVLGVQPLEPGFRRTRIAPYFGELTSVAGRVPTPLGVIEVDLTPSGGSVVIPDGITARVTSPSGDEVELTSGRHDVSFAGAGAREREELQTAGASGGDTH